MAERCRDRLPGADIGRSFIRLKRLEDVDEAVLRELVRTTAERCARDRAATFAE